MKVNICFFIDKNQNFYHSSLLYVGLLTLLKHRNIELRFHHPQNAGERVFVIDPLTVCLKIEATDGSRPKLLAIDLHDQSNIFAMEALEHCDLYLKRNFYLPDVIPLPVSFQEKIQPFGLNFACRNLTSSAILLRSIGVPLLLQGKTGIKRLHQYLSLPYTEDFEQNPSKQLQQTVVFQTRIWDTEEMGYGRVAEVNLINEERVALIRTLKKAFGDRFRGGLVPTPLAISRYPDEISKFSSRRKQYAAMSRQNLIGIYTRGLFDSNAFKLPEYLAGSQCIVAEPIRNKLPNPLKEDINYLSFRNPEECVQACHRLLNDHIFSETMRYANFKYYTMNVEPSSCIARLLGLALPESNWLA